MLFNLSHLTFSSFTPLFLYYDPRLANDLRDFVLDSSLSASNEESPARNKDLQLQPFKLFTSVSNTA